MKLRTGVVLLAAGSSQRFGKGLPKQFLLFNKEPLFVKSLRLFLRTPSVIEIALVVHRDHFTFAENWKNKMKHSQKITIVLGGAFRGESVKNGVKSLAKKLDVVLVHDSARPMITADIISRVEHAAYKTGAALAAWPLPDTLKQVKGRLVKKTIPRENLWLAQTPQGFRRDVANRCLLKPTPLATDDVELAQRKGFKVEIVKGASTNIKITYAADLDLCRRIAK
jgi:2-C-methyl-D-erythritol 4-phosphate cytidylyltransferase